MCLSVRQSMHPYLPNVYTTNRSSVYLSTCLTEMTINIISNQYNDDKFSRFTPKKKKRLREISNCIGKTTHQKTWPEWQFYPLSHRRWIDGQFVSLDKKIYKLFKKALSKGFSINKYKTIRSDRMYSGMQNGRNERPTKSFNRKLVR